MLKSLVSGALIGALASAYSPEKDALRQFQEIVYGNGYAMEHYTLVTPDEYVLTLYRIPGKFTKEKRVEARPAVLMMHSQDWDMTQWVSNDADKANAFILADAGYDVWMGNNRGSNFSRGHVKYDRHSFEFWQFYQEQLGLQDVPTFIDFILEKTGLESLSYIGHSCGTTQMFMALALMPEYFEQRVNVFAAMAPPVYIKSMTDPATVAEAEHWPLLKAVMEKIHLYNFIYFSPQLHEEVVELCQVVPKVCQLINGQGGGWLLPEVDNLSRGQVMLANFPGGSGYLNTIFYGQCVATGGEFRKFDYGRAANMAIYGQVTPPEVPIENISIPVALFNGDRDPLIAQSDVEFLIDALGDNMVFHKVIPGDHWTFSMSQDMSWFKDDLVNVLQTYNPTDKDAASIFLQ